MFNVWEQWHWFGRQINCIVIIETNYIYAVMARNDIIVLVYGTRNISGNRRLDTFILSVGDSRDISTHAPCATHTNSVRAGGHVNVTCLAIGRYVSFKRNKGYEANIATLCEVVVIGHRYTGKWMWYLTLGYHRTVLIVGFCIPLWSALRFHYLLILNRVFRFYC